MVIEWIWLDTNGVKLHFHNQDINTVKFHKKRRKTKTYLHSFYESSLVQRLSHYYYNYLRY